MKKTAYVLIALLVCSIISYLLGWWIGSSRMEIKQPEPQPLRYELEHGLMISLSDGLSKENGISRVKNGKRYAIVLMDSANGWRIMESPILKLSPPYFVPSWVSQGLQISPLPIHLLILRHRDGSTHAIGSRLRSITI